MRVHGPNSATNYETGNSYYWQPAHNLEAVTDTEYLELTPSDNYDTLMAHCRTRHGQVGPPSTSLAEMTVP